MTKKLVVYVHFSNVKHILPAHGHDLYCLSFAMFSYFSLVLSHHCTGNLPQRAILVLFVHCLYFDILFFIKTDTMICLL